MHPGLVDLLGKFGLAVARQRLPELVGESRKRVSQSRKVDRHRSERRSRTAARGTSESSPSRRAGTSELRRCCVCSTRAVPPAGGLSVSWKAAQRQLAPRRQLSRRPTTSRRSSRRSIPVGRERQIKSTSATKRNHLGGSENRRCTPTTLLNPRTRVLHLLDAVAQHPLASLRSETNHVFFDASASLEERRSPTLCAQYRALRCLDSEPLDRSTPLPLDAAAIEADLLTSLALVDRSAPRQIWERFLDHASRSIAFEAHGADPDPENDLLVLEVERAKRGDVVYVTAQRRLGVELIRTGTSAPSCSACYLEPGGRRWLDTDPDQTIESYGVTSAGIETFRDAVEGSPAFPALKSSRVIRFIASAGFG